jgi:hypothetical protein
VLEQQETIRSLAKSDVNSQILGQVLRGVEIEYKHTSTSIHLASADTGEVDSLLLALDEIMKIRAEIQSDLESEAARAAAPHLLAKLVAEVRALRNSEWPEHYRSCEALQRLLDTLELAQGMLATKAASASSRLYDS